MWVYKQKNLGWVMAKWIKSKLCCMAKKIVKNLCPQQPIENTKNEERKKQEDYFVQVFGTEYPCKDKVEAALKYAHEIRQFEIRLYWQRSLFFWGFIVVLFGGFFLLLDAWGKLLMENSATQEVLVIKAIFIGITIVGFLITYAWLFVERGSSTWQENWENHIDYLEDDITGRLHKTVIGEPNDFFSIKKVHRTVIGIICFFWFFLGISSFWIFTTLNDVYIHALLTFLIVAFPIFIQMQYRGFFVFPKCWRSSKKTIGSKPETVYLRDRPLPKLEE